MYSTNSNNRIAKNTVVLYLRMIYTMVVILYTSRVILATLGVEDFGIYNIVGGVVGLFMFVNSTMTSATSRFLTYEIGRGNDNDVRETFSASIWAHVVIAILILLLCETIGLWFVENKMVIPISRVDSARIVYQLSILSVLVTIIQVPFNAILISHENMSAYAVIDILNVTLKLLVLYLLVYLSYDKLVLYAVLILIINVFTFLVYVLYTRYCYQECRYLTRWKKRYIMPMFSFSFWDLYGNMAVAARTQGVNMLLNVFFGPIANAASAISTSVQNAVMSFAANVNTAVRPQIIKSYALGDYNEMSELIISSCKINFLIMLIISAPLYAEMETVLRLWLGDYPEMAINFCRLTLLFSLFANLSYLVNTGVHAYGNIKKPSIVNGTLYLLVIPFSYFLFLHYSNPIYPFIFNILAVFIGMCYNVKTLHGYINQFSIMAFIKEVIFKCLLLIAVAGLVIYLSNILPLNNTIKLILLPIATTISLSLVGWFLMLTTQQKNYLLNFIRNVLWWRR